MKVLLAGSITSPTHVNVTIMIKLLPKGWRMHMTIDTRLSFSLPGYELGYFLDSTSVDVGSPESG